VRLDLQCGRVRRYGVTRINLCVAPQGGQAAVQPDVRGFGADMVRLTEAQATSAAPAALNSVRARIAEAEHDRDAAVAAWQDCIRLSAVQGAAPPGPTSGRSASGPERPAPAAVARH